MDMNRKGGRYTGMPCFRRNKQIKTLQTPYCQRWKKSRRAFPYISFRGSLTLEAALVLPIFLCAITALLYLYAFTSHEAKEYRSLMEKAQFLAITVGQISKEDPNICLYDYERVALPFQVLSFGKSSVVRKASVRAWVGYTDEKFEAKGQDTLVYITPQGSVYHRNSDCTYLSLTIHSISSAQLERERNISGGKYSPCEYCVKNKTLANQVYITDYGTSFHNSKTCQGLKRTIMAVPFSQVKGWRCCSKCGAL